MQYDPEGVDPPIGFDWDPDKEASNREKHGIRFRRASLVFFDENHVDEDSTRPGHDELRRKATGSVMGTMITVIYTIRDGKRRIISVRGIRPDERRAYRQGQGLP